MSPTASLRSALAYAGSLLAQVPFLQDLPNPFSPPVGSGLQGVGETLSRPSFSPYTGDVTPYDPLSGAPSCPIDGPVSCHNSTPVAGDQSCCFVYPGGRILLTQFWDRDVHAGGAEEDWTLHGLWCVFLPSLPKRLVHILGVIQKEKRHGLTYIYGCVCVKKA